ncbi:MAG: hypothetical protein HYX80_07820 [Chloroflexi bacterium]|nr:hypothetical protein [Chloroflexota bacterium]
MEAIGRPIKFEDYADITSYLFVQAEASEVREQVMKDLAQMDEGNLMRLVANEVLMYKQL